MKQSRPLGHFPVVIVDCITMCPMPSPLSLKNTCQPNATWSCVLLLCSLSRKKEAPARVKLANFGHLGGDLCQISYRLFPPSLEQLLFFDSFISSILSRCC